MSGWIVGGMAAMAVATAGASMYSANKQAKATKAAANQQAAASAKALEQQKTAYNKENQKSADVSSILEENTASDMGTTMLTGANGANAASSGSLGKGYTLLGG